MNFASIRNVVFFFFPRFWRFCALNLFNVTYVCVYIYIYVYIHICIYIYIIDITRYIYIYIIDITRKHLLPWLYAIHLLSWTFVSCIPFKPAPEPSGQKHQNQTKFLPPKQSGLSRRAFFSYGVATHVDWYKEPTQSSTGSIFRTMGVDYCGLFNDIYDMNLALLTHKDHRLVRFK